MENPDLKLKTQLVFWQLFETGLNYNSLLNVASKNSVNNILQETGYEILDQDLDDVPDYYYRHLNYEKYLFEDFHDFEQKEKVKWLALTAKQYMPVCFEIYKGRFTSTGDLRGTIVIEIHIHYGGAILFDNKLLYEGMHSVSDYCRGSTPGDIKLPEWNTSLWDFMVEKKNEIIKLLNDRGIKAKERMIDIKLEDIVHPWHHNWIILGHEFVSKEDYDGERWQRDFLKGNKYYLHALGLAQRMTDWYKMSTDFYDFKNLSPYVNSAVYITNAGNVIVPNFELLDPDSFKNKLVDVIFASELGNAQRFLFLIHVTYVSKRAVLLQKQIESIKHGDMNEDDLTDTILKLEEDLNRDFLEITDDIMPARVSRLMFSSILKLTLFKEMIDQLNGYEYETRLKELLDQMQGTLAREREVLAIRSSQRENELLKNLQLVFIITLATELIALFFYDSEAAATGFSFGIQLLGVAIIASAVLYTSILAYSKFKNK